MGQPILIIPHVFKISAHFQAFYYLVPPATPEPSSRGPLGNPCTQNKLYSF